MGHYVRLLTTAVCADEYLVVQFKGQLELSNPQFDAATRAEIHEHMRLCKKEMRELRKKIPAKPK
jgi:hypothetical protein